MVQLALEFATVKHQGQVRKVSGVPYVTHPIHVAELLTQYKQSKRIDELKVACLLHDTLEDTNTTLSEIISKFGSLVGNLVNELTSDTTEIQRVGKVVYLKHKMVGMSSYGLTLKLLDRLSNISDSPKTSYIEDTVDMMNFIFENRQVNRTQYKIINDILTICKEKLNDSN
jgi:(p)ppGpp synthase/HD superfamily hydrolase